MKLNTEYLPSLMRMEAKFISLEGVSITLDAYLHLVHKSCIWPNYHTNPDAIQILTNNICFYKENQKTTHKNIT